MYLVHHTLACMCHESPEFHCDRFRPLVQVCSAQFPTILSESRRNATIDARNRARQWQRAEARVWMSKTRTNILPCMSCAKELIQKALMVLNAARIPCSTVNLNGFSARYSFFEQSEEKNQHLAMDEIREIWTQRVVMVLDAARISCLTVNLNGSSARYSSPGQSDER